jgi:hypothetical protein
MTRRKFFVFSIVAMSIAALAALIVVLAVDVYLHHRLERSAGVNVWGYRGPSVGRKQPTETRVAVFGGSTAFGYGVLWNEAWGYVLEQALNRRASGRQYTVVNLAYNSEAAYSFKPTMEDYDYLDFDIAVFYEGYNDLGDAPRIDVFRRTSPVFRLTGYLPIFPMIFREKAFALMNAGDVTAGYEGTRGRPQTVFRPGMATQVGAAALEAAAATANSLEKQLGKLTREREELREVTPTTGCEERWHHYCGAQAAAITAARSRGRAVLVVTQPYISDQHVEQQRALIGMLKNHFGADTAVAYANVGPVVDLRNVQLAFDGMHLPPDGDRLVGEALVEPVLALERVAFKR